MALTDLTRLSTAGIATGSTIDSPILRKDVDFRGNQVGVTSALFDSSERQLDFKDNVKVRFGDSQDLSIYHESSSTTNWIEGAGLIRLQTSSGNIEICPKNGAEKGARFVTDGAAELYHDGSLKIATTSTGAIVTGILTATTFSGGIIGGGGITAGIVTCTGFDLNGNGDVSGNFVIGGDLAVNGTTTTIDTNLIGVDRIEVGANSNTIVGVAITQSGTADILQLFDGASKVVTVDDEGKVGIGIAVPTNALDVQGGTTNTAIVARSTDAKAQVSLVDNSTSSVGSVCIGAEGDALFLTSGSGGAEALRITSAGKISTGGLAAPTSDMHIWKSNAGGDVGSVSYTQLRAHETREDLVWPLED